MKRKYIVVSPESFCYGFETGTKWEAVDGVPRGSKFRGFVHDPLRNTINIFLEHDSFPDVPPGMLCEELPLTFRRIP